MEERTFPLVFNPSDLGKTLKEVSTDILQTSRHDVISRWFHSSKDADLYIWTDLKHNIIKQQLSYYGQIVEWNVVEGLKTGHVIIDESSHGRKGSELLRFDHTAQATSLRQALDVMAHVVALTPAEREALIRNFRKSGSMRNVSADEFAEEMGELIRLPRPPAPIKFVKRLVTRVRRWFNF